MLISISNDTDVPEYRNYPGMDTTIITGIGIDNTAAAKLALALWTKVAHHPSWWPLHRRHAAARRLATAATPVIIQKRLLLCRHAALQAIPCRS